MQLGVRLACLGEELQRRLELRVAQRPAATHARSKAGPPPLARGSSVLDDEDAIWAADDMDDARRADAEALIAAQGGVLAPFWVDKYDREAAKAWDRFYRRTSVARSHSRCTHGTVMTLPSDSSNSFTPCACLLLFCLLYANLHANQQQKRAKRQSRV